jgi:hypothetical protein
MKSTPPNLVARLQNLIKNVCLRYAPRIQLSNANDRLWPPWQKRQPPASGAAFWGIAAVPRGQKCQ